MWVEQAQGLVSARSEVTVEPHEAADRDVVLVVWARAEDGVLGFLVWNGSATPSTGSG